MRWLEPSTEKEIKRCAQQGKEVLLVPISFVSEHSETLVELDIEYKKLYLENGGNNYLRAPSLSCNKKFIESLASLCLKLHKKCFEGKVCSSTEGRDCPNRFKGCINDE